MMRGAVSYKTVKDGPTEQHPIDNMPPLAAPAHPVSRAGPGNWTELNHKLQLKMLTRFIK